jgi:hypothetical protein
MLIISQNKIFKSRYGAARETESLHECFEIDPKVLSKGRYHWVVAFEDKDLLHALRTNDLWLMQDEVAFLEAVEQYLSSGCPLTKGMKDAAVYLFYTMDRRKQAKIFRG